MPGREHDASYVRSLVITGSALDSAIEVLSTAAGTPFLECIDSIAVNSSSASVQVRNSEELAALTPSFRNYVWLNGFGAVLELGVKQPAAIYWGDPDGQERVELAMQLLEKECKARPDPQRYKPVLASTAGLLIAGTGAALALLDRPSALGIVGIALGLMVALASAVRLRLRDRLTLIVPRAHLLELGR